MIMEKKLFLHAWSIQKLDNEYFLPYTHWVYLREIVKYYDKVVLLSPCQYLKGDERTTSVSLAEFSNVSVYELPDSKGGYVRAIKHFISYKKAYKSIKGISTYYSRYPTPFGWLQKVYGKDARRVIHYVGDPVDAAINNPNFSKWKKKILTFMFKPENKLYDWACKGAEVFTNGHHIAERLEKKGITAVPLISSTLTDDDFYFEENKMFCSSDIKLLYVGYLRKAKGVETVLRAFKGIVKERPNSILSVVGSGEFENELKQIVKTEYIPNVDFLGHIDKREELNKIYRSHDIFMFASLSEGSPRVVLEAMSNGMAVVSTPVGSLPNTFHDKEDIVFANFNDIDDFESKALELYENKNIESVRRNSYNKVRSFTIDNFLKTIFYED